MLKGALVTTSGFWLAITSSSVTLCVDDGWARQIGLCGWRRVYLHTTRHTYFNTGNASIPLCHTPLHYMTHPFTTLYAPFTTLYAPFTPWHTYFTTWHFPFTTRHTPFTTRHTPFPTWLTMTIFTLKYIKHADGKVKHAGSTLSTGGKSPEQADWESIKPAEGWEVSENDCRPWRWIWAK